MADQITDEERAQLDIQIQALDEASDKFRRAAKILRRLRDGVIEIEHGDPDSIVSIVREQRLEQVALAAQLTTEAKVAGEKANPTDIVNAPELAPVDQPAEPVTPVGTK